MKTAEEYFKENKIHRKLVASDFVITERHLGKIITEDRQSIVDKIKEMIDKLEESRSGGRLTGAALAGVNITIIRLTEILNLIRGK